MLLGFDHQATIVQGVYRLLSLKFWTPLHPLVAPGMSHKFARHQLLQAAGTVPWSLIVRVKNIANMIESDTSR